MKCGDCKHKHEFSTSERCKDCRRMGYWYRIFYSLWEQEDASPLLSTDQNNPPELRSGHPDFDWRGMCETVGGIIDGSVLCLGKALEPMDGEHPARFLLNQVLASMKKAQALINPEPAKTRKVQDVPEAKEDAQAEIQTLRETNSRLNRRCQKLESVIAKSRQWSLGCEHGRKSTWDEAVKFYEKKLAQYKYGTRQQMQRLEKDNDSYIEALREGK